MTVKNEMLTDDLCEAKARELQDCLTSRGVKCFVHWDRSPWGVRIPLTASEDEFAPALFVLTEGTRSVGVHGKAEVEWFGQDWIGQLGGFATDLTDTTFRWLERPWAGGGTPDIADALLPLLRILRMGAYSVWDIDNDGKKVDVAAGEAI